MNKEYRSENFSQNTPINYGDKIGINTVLIYCFDIFVYDNLLYIGSLNYLNLFNIENSSSPKYIDSYESCLSLAGNDNYLFATQNDYYLEKLSYFDLKSNATKIEDTNPAIYRCIKITCESNYLYAIINDYSTNEKSTLSCFNVTKPNEVNFISNFTIDFVHFEINSNILNLFAKNNILYYLDYSGHLTIINYSDPFNPKLLIKYENVPILNLFLLDDYLFLLTSHYLTIYNNTNPSNLKKVASYNYEGFVSIFVKDKRIYLIGKESFYILDASNIQNLKLLDKYERGKREQNDFKKIVVYNDIACIMTEWLYSQNGGTQTAYYIFDISNPYEIKREYPIKFQRDPLDFFAIFYSFLFIVLPIIIIVLLPITIWLIVKKIKKKRGK